jgi:acyl-CoA reductase-like NAD-dependent aldehyde dehydrogenase
VGPGNAIVLISADADLGHAARSAVLSKAFNNGLICGAEHNLVVAAVYASA